MIGLSAFLSGKLASIVFRLFQCDWPNQNRPYSPIYDFPSFVDSNLVLVGCLRDGRDEFILGLWFFGCKLTNWRRFEFEFHFTDWVS